MANKNNENIQAQAQVSEYAINAMRPAIIAQSLNGINRAITKDDAAKCGISEERWNQWGVWVSDLREACTHYAELQADRNTPENGKLMKSAEGKVWQQWRSILKVGEENLFHKNMFLRRSDVEKLTTFAGNIKYVFVPGKGKVPAVTGKNDFRKLVETFLACRIAGNALLSDTQRDVIKGYTGACASEKKYTELLNGTAEETGLRDVLTAKENALNEVIKALEQAKVKEELMDQIVAPAKLARDNAKKDVDDAEKNLKSAQDKQAELKQQYDEIVALLDAIENPAE